jgi:antitoxin VapB
MRPRALISKNDEVVSLANEVALLAYETRTEAVRRSPEERRERLLAGPRRLPLAKFLEQQVWPLIPADVVGTTFTREDENLILGYGPDGY